MGNIKSLLVEFIMAFLLGIAGNIAIFYAFIFTDAWGAIDCSAIALFTGLPLGSSLGIFLTKKYILRTGKFSVLCLFTSFVFGFLAARFLCMAIPDYICDLMSLGSTIVFCKCLGSDRMPNA